MRTFVFGVAIVLAGGFRAAGQATAVAELVPSAEAAAVLSARAPTDVEDLRLIEDQLQRVLAKVVPATASVEIGRAAGSGVVVSADGLVLTAAHVIGRPGRRAWVELPDGRRLRGTTLGADHEADAGMVRLDSPPANLPFAPVAEGGDRVLTPGEWVITTGQPGGLVSGRTPPVRLGRVLFFDDDMLCTDCKLVGGDSGGPLFNMRGEVVGIHSSIGPSLTHNFHVPITAFRRDWQRLLASEVWGGRYDDEDRDRAVLGVSGNASGGRCVISAVADEMPAARAGVRVGDIVTSVNGVRVSSFDELKVIVASKQPGDRLRLTLDRAGDAIELVAQLSKPDGSVPPERRPPRDE